MREMDEYERNWLNSPERAAIEKRMWNEFYRSQFEQNYEKGHGCSVIVAIIILALILYCSIWFMP